MMRRSRHGLGHDRDADDYDDEEDVPLHHKRPFGSGLKRQKVEFVRAVDADVGTIAATKPAGPEIGDIYASIVMAKPKTAPSADGEGNSKATVNVCEVCSLPIATSMDEHVSTLAHQVSLTHSHPPSALDRTRMGYRTLASTGWDVDARRGLGREGEGVRFPIKVAKKDDTLGIGAEALPAPVREEKPKALTSKERKDLERQTKKKNDKIYKEVFGDGDVESILRGEKAGGTGLRR